ncbi:ribonuclease HII [candidate division NPL-UPA2 bacterium]|nr:ribonuclease HII [candidate division NPL-UPA2 bacterium]
MPKILRREIRDREQEIRFPCLSRYEKRLWREGFSLIAGIDEAGRGPLAGPVVAAAVILPRDIFLPSVDDSKKLSSQKREEVFSEIGKGARAIGVGVVGEVTIDRINILQATYLAMRQAVAELKAFPDYLLVDGMTLPGLDTPQLAIVKGDSLSISIAAASIVAKVTRDRIMAEKDKRFPQYGFAQHKGYGTKVHLKALDEYGVSPLHRRSFRPVKERLSKV